MKHFKLTIVGGLLAGMLIIPGMPAMADDDDDDDHKGKRKRHGHLIIPGMPAMADDDDDDDHKGKRKRHGHSLHIPRGHLPPPGKCRIWYPGRAPGHQPPPGDCQMLSRQLSQGAVLVSRDRHWRHDEHPHYHYHPRHVYHSRPAWWDDHRHGVYDRRSYDNRREIRKDIRDIREMAYMTGVAMPIEGKFDRI